MPTPGVRERLNVQQLYDDLHARILTGQLRPGTLLSEARVGEEYGLSRTPIRQAFHRLADAGFLHVVPQVGTYVAPIEVAAVRDAQFVRETLECRAVERAAQSERDDKADLLGPAMDEQKRAIAKGDHFGFFLADEAFHRAIMEIAGHPHVWSLIVSAKVQLDRLRYLSLESPEWLAMIYAQHEDLLARILAHDSGAAAGLMQAHLRTAFEAIDRIATEHAAFFADESRPASLPRPGLARSKHAG
jgi:DNA-binding GntR family transcriptional regulator